MSEFKAIMLGLFTFFLISFITVFITQNGLLVLWFMGLLLFFVIPIIILTGIYLYIRSFRRQTAKKSNPWIIAILIMFAISIILLTLYYANILPNSVYYRIRL
jgi:hypothetical protein